MLITRDHFLQNPNATMSRLDVWLGKYKYQLKFDTFERIFSFKHEVFSFTGLVLN